MYLVKQFLLAGESTPINYFDTLGLWDIISKAEPASLLTNNPTKSFTRHPLNIYKMLNPFARKISYKQLNAHTYGDSLTGAQFISMDLHLTNGNKTSNQTYHLRSDSIIDFSRKAERSLSYAQNGIISTTNCGISMPATREIITSLPLEKRGLFKDLIERINSLDLWGDSSKVVVCKVDGDIKPVNKIELFNEVMRYGLKGVHISHYRNNTKATEDIKDIEKLHKKIADGEYDMVFQRGSYGDGTLEKIKLLNVPSNAVKETLGKFLRASVKGNNELSIFMNSSSFKPVSDFVSIKTEEEVTTIQKEIENALTDIDLSIHFDYENQLEIKNIEKKIPKFARDTYDFSIVKNFAYNFSLFPFENEPLQLLSLIKQLHEGKRVVNVFDTEITFDNSVPFENLVELYKFYLLCKIGDANLTGLEQVVQWLTNKYKGTETKYSPTEFFIITMCRFLAYHKGMSYLIYRDADDIYSQDIHSFYNNIFNRVPLLQEDKNLNMFLYMLLESLSATNSQKPHISTNPLD